MLSRRTAASIEGSARVRLALGVVAGEPSRVDADGGVGCPPFRLGVGPRRRPGRGCASSTSATSAAEDQVEGEDDEEGEGDADHDGGMEASANGDDQDFEVVAGADRAAASESSNSSARTHRHLGDYVDRERLCPDGKEDDSWACRLADPWYSSPRSPSRTNRLYTPLGFAQVSCRGLLCVW